VPALKVRLPLPVLLYLLAVVIPIAFRLGPLYMTSLRLFLILVIVPLTINLLAGKYGKILATDIFFFLHILWTAVAIAVNNPSEVVQTIGSIGMEFLGGYVVGRAYIRDRQTFLALCRTLIVIVICTIPFAVIEALTTRPLIIETVAKLPGISSVAIVHIEARLGLDRAQVIFSHPIHYGLFCSVAFSLSMIALKGTVNNMRRFLTSLAIVGTGFLALSSGAILAFALQFGLITWAVVFRGLNARWWLLTGLFVCAYVAIDLLSNRAPVDVFMTYATFSAHTAYWRSIIFEWGLANVIGSVEKGIPPSPFFGLGLNDWVRPFYMPSSSIDNFWLMMAYRSGLPGLALITIGYVLMIARVMRRNFEGDERLILIRRAWVFTFMGLTFTLCTVHIWTNIYSFVFFMLGAGAWLITTIPNAGAEDAAQDSSADQQVAAKTSRYSRFPTKDRTLTSNSTSPSP